MKIKPKTKVAKKVAKKTVKKTVNKVEDKKGFKSVQDGYTVEIKYNDESKNKKLIKFSVGESSFEISTEKLIELVSHYVNGEELAPMFVDNERINIVYVKRQIQARLDKDFKEGDILNFEYSHPYPLEFAILEEASKLALIEKDREGVIVTPELIKRVKDAMPSQNENFIKKFYESFKNLFLSKKT